MTTSLQRSSLGELGYSPLAATSLGELGALAIITIVPGGGITDGVEYKRVRPRRQREQEELELLILMVSVIEQDRDH